MKVTSVKVSKVNSDTKMKALASITIENSLVVNDIKVIESSNGLFIAMPSRKTPNGEFKDICFPITKEAREEITQAILKKYNEIEVEQDSTPF